MANEQILTPMQVIEKLNFLSAERKNWENHWQEIADFIIPRKNDITRRSSPGEKKQQIILDNTAQVGLERLAGALHGLLTNPSVRFFDLTTGDLALDNKDKVRQWLDDTGRRVMNVLNNSNFQTEVHELYLDLGGFGTAAMTIEEDPRMVVRFSSKYIREIYIDENNFGAVDEVFRRFKWNSKQIIQEFSGKSSQVIPEPVLKSHQKQDNTHFDIFHAVYPRKLDSRNPGKLPWVSQYVLEQTRTNLRVSGFEEFPYVVTRWSKVTGEKYGRSPGMNALPEAKTLNKMVETVLRGAQKVVDPPLQVPDDGFITNIRTRPGSLNFYRAGTSDRIEPVFNDARIDFGFQAMEERRARIRDSFFQNELNLREGPQMTAAEVDARQQESLRFLGPVLGRQQSEFLKPLIDRVIEIMFRRDMLLKPPAEIQEMDLDVEYSSVIARAQRSNQANTILRSLDQIGLIGAIDPAVFDNIDTDKTVRALAKLNALPQEIIRDQKTIKQIRDARSEAQQQALDQQRQVQQADIVSKVGPALQGAGGQ